MTAPALTVIAVLLAVIAALAVLLYCGLVVLSRVYGERWWDSE